MSTEGGARAVVAALIANLGIAVAKFVAWAVTGSASMLSEGIHSLADSGNQVLLLIGGKRSKVAPDAAHPFGYGRRRYVYGFVVSMILFSVGGLFAVSEGIHKIEHPEQIRDAQWAIGVYRHLVIDGDWQWHLGRHWFGIDWAAAANDRGVFGSGNGKHVGR